ncbi:MAG: hypothetical protein HY291_12805 [Planctomycetes bacterium]|nr:hypothetical protein [Planctomycetota bacterium]
MSENASNRLLHELILSPNVSSKKQTRSFAKYRHDDDLCPALEKQVNELLGILEKYQKISHKVHGLNDHGVDLLVKITKDETASHIGMQIKSDSEFEAKDLIRTLKAQYYDAVNYYNDLNYYILLCCDLSNKARTLIVSRIATEFAKKSDVMIVEPGRALQFLQMSQMQIAATVRFVFGTDDIVYKKGLRAVIDLIPTERAILFTTILRHSFGGYNSTTRSDIIESSFVEYVNEHTAQRPRDWFFQKRGIVDFTSEEVRNLESDLDYLEGHLINLSDSEQLLPNLDDEEIQALTAIMLDAKVRFKYEDSDLLDYMMNAFGRQKGYTPPTELAKEVEEE